MSERHYLLIQLIFCKDHSEKQKSGNYFCKSIWGLQHKFISETFLVGNETFLIISLLLSHLISLPEDQPNGNWIWIYFLLLLRSHSPSVSPVLWWCPKGCLFIWVVWFKSSSFRFYNSPHIGSIQSHLYQHCATSIWDGAFVSFCSFRLLIILWLPMIEKIWGGCQALLYLCYQNFQHFHQSHLLSFLLASR